MFDDILIVCVANICRSPIVGILLHKALPHKTISSAGIHAVAGKPMSPHSATLTSTLGLSLECSQHKSQPLTTAMCRKADLILVMEKTHIDAVMAIDPTVTGKIFLVGKWLDDAEIPDPYQQSFEMYEHVFALIQRATDQWVTKLK